MNSDSANAFCRLFNQPGITQCRVFASRKTSRSKWRSAASSAPSRRPALLTELRSREFYEKPTSERKRKLAAAVKRHHKRIRSQMLPPKMY